MDEQKDNDLKHKSEEIKKEYDKFLAKMSLLKNKQKIFIEEYKDKLKQRRISNIKKELGVE